MQVRVVGQCLYFFCFSTFIPVPLSSLSFFFISSTLSYLFSPFLWKMTQKDWHVIKPQHNQSEQDDVNDVSCTRMTTLPFLLLALSPVVIFDSDLCPQLRRRWRGILLLGSSPIHHSMDELLWSLLVRPSISSHLWRTAPETSEPNFFKLHVEPCVKGGLKICTNGHGR